MKRFLLLTLLFILTACAPGVTATLSGSEGDYTVTVVAEATLYDARVSILDAVADAPECSQIGPDVICSYDTLAAGSSLTIDVTGTLETACRVGGFLNPGDLTSYRSYNCRVT